MHAPSSFTRLLTILGLAALCGWAQAGEAPVTVELDTSETPELAPWGQKVRDILIEWHPRITNLLSSKGFTPTRKIGLTLKKADKGIGHTSGNKITVFSNWIQKHPEDVGLAVHELVHIIQAYPPSHHGWVTEGIADYIRWAIYEGKPQAWFPRSNKPDGYKQGYRVTAGFLLWLETDTAPGIVRKLNTAMRKKAYKDELFKELTGKSLPELWKAYLEGK